MTGNQNILRVLVETAGKGEVSHIDDLYNFFTKINNNNQNFNHSFLLNYLYKNISSELVSKRKTTSRDFEDFLGILFNGLVTDEDKRTNKKFESLYVENDFISDFVRSNKREKIDIDFQTGYEMSVKTLIHTNKEINFGSFEKTALFYGFGVNEYLNERKGQNGIGLGSKPQLRKLLNTIESSGEYLRFRKRFLAMFKEIFSDDILIAIKKDLDMEIYFVQGKAFYTLVEDSSHTVEDLLTILNRWEGNSIRMNREKILKVGKKVSLDFRFLIKSIIEQINIFEEKISKYIILYINNYKDKEKYRDLIIKECGGILEKIDKNITIL